MKRCSTCNRTYTDPNLSFCIDDGTPLTPVADPQDETTVVTPRDNAGAYQPPSSYVPPGTHDRRRRVWPWVLGILGAFILGIVAISVAAAILVPRLMRSRQNEPSVSTVEPRNTNRPENSNTAEPANTNTRSANANVNVDVPPPTDHDQVLAQLTNLENDWTVANINADKVELDRILADDYVGPAPDGGLQSKAEYIRTIQRNTDIEKWKFDDLKLKLSGDRATLSGKVKLELPDGDRKFEFTDKFVWRDGRWQATGSEVNPKD